MTEEIRQLQDKFSANPQDQEVFLALANNYESQQQWKPLSSMYETVSSLKETDDALALNKELARRLTAIINGFRPKQASDEEKQSISELCVYLGDVYINKIDDHDNAMNMYQQAFKVWNKDTTCLERARGVYASIGNFERVLVLLGLEQRVHKKGKNQEKLIATHIEMANIYGQKMGDPVKGLEQIFSAQLLDEEDPRVQVAFNRLAAHEDLTEMTTNMVQRAEALLEDNPKDAAHLLARCARLEQANYRGDDEKSIYYIELAKELDADNTSYAKTHQRILQSQQEAEAYNNTQVLWAADAPEQPPTEAPAAQQEGMFEEVALPDDVSEVESVPALESTQIINLDTHGAPPLDDQIEALDDSLLEEVEPTSPTPPSLPPSLPPKTPVDATESVTPDVVEEPIVEPVEAIEPTEALDEPSSPEDDAQQNELDEDAEEEIELEEIDPSEASIAIEEDVASEPSDAKEDVVSDVSNDDAVESDTPSVEETDEDEEIELEEIDPSEASIATEETETVDAVEPVTESSESSEEAVAQDEQPEETQDDAQDDAQDDVVEDAPQDKEEEVVEDAPAQDTPAPQPVSGAEILPLAATSAGSTALDEDGYAEAKAILKKEPTNLAQLANVQQWCLANGELDELAKQMEHSVKYLRNKDGEFDVMRDLAILFWKDLKNMKKAEYYFKRLRYQDADMPEVQAFYEEYFYDRGEWRKLHKHLADQLKALENKETQERDLVKRLAALSENEMGSPEKAIDAWRTLLTRYDGDEESKTQLRRLYETHEKWPALIDYIRDDIDALEKQGEDTIDERVALLIEMDEIYRDKMPGGDINRINTLNQLMALSPQNRQGFGALRELLSSNRRFNELATLLGEQAEQAHQEGDIARAVTLLTEVADLWQNDLRNVSQALPHLERILEIDNWHGPTRERLKEIYGQRRDYSALFDMLEQETDQQEGDDALRTHFEALLELAQDRLRDPEKAIPILQRLLDLNPNDVSLYDRLEQIYKRQDDWASMAKVLERKASLDLSDKVVIQTASQAAEIYEKRLEQPEPAAILWQRVLTLDEDNSKAFSRLTDIYVEHKKFDELESLYEQRDALDRYYGILNTVAQQSKEDAPSADVYRRLATLSEEKLSDPERVISSLEKLLDVTEDKRAVATELIGWYRAQNQPADEIEMHKLLLELAPDNEARFEELRSLAELEIQREHDQDALRWLFEAIRVKPDDVETIDNTEALAKHVGVLGDFLDHLEIIADGHEETPKLQESLWHRVARLARDEREDNARAIELFERLHERNPEDMPTLNALESLYDKAQEPEKRIAALTTVIGLLQSQDAPEHDVVSQMVKIASVQHRHLRQTDEAQQTYMRVLDVDPDDMTAIQGLRDLFMEQQRWGDVIEMIQREFNLTPIDDDNTRNLLRTQLATIHSEQLDDPAQALIHYGEILGESPDHESTLEQTESLMRDERVARDAALMLEPLFRSNDAHARLAEALQARHGVCSDTFEEQEILEELVPLYITQLEDESSAFPWAARRFELDANNQDRWDEMGQLGQNLDRWNDVEKLFTSFAPFEDDSDHEDRYALLGRIAKIRENQLGDQPGALAAWNRLYHYERTDLTVVDNLDRLYRALGNHDALIETLEAKSVLKSDPDERAVILLEAGDLADSVQNKTDRAIGLYQQVLEIDQANDQAVDHLIRLFVQEQRWQDLDDLYTEQAQLNSEKRRVFMLAQSTLRTQHTQDDQGAFDLLRQLLSENSEDAQALDILIELDAQIQSRDATSPLRLDIALEMERIYRTLNDYPSLIQVLETRLTFTEDPFEQLALFDELAELYLGRVGDKNLSFDRTRDAVVLMPDEAERRERLERLADDLDRFTDVVGAYEKAAQNTSDPFVKAALFKRMGQLHVSHLHEDARAITAYEQALEVEETDVETLKAVEALYMKTTDFAQLSDNLNKQVQYVEFEERPTLLRRIGDLEENHLQRAIEATTAYERLRELEPQSMDALDALERLYERGENWIDLSELLSSKSLLQEDTDEKLQTLLKLAQTHQYKLENVPEAILTYQQMRGDEPLHVDALEALDNLYQQEHQFIELGEILRAKLQLPVVAQDPDLRETLELRLADILAQQHESDESVNLYLGVFERNPGQQQALVALDGFVRDMDYTERISPALTQFYQTKESWPQLVDLKQVQRDLSDEPSQQAQYNWEIAKIYDGFMDERQPDAIDALADAWRLQPHEDNYLSDLLALCAQQEAWAKLCGVFEDVILDVSDFDRQKALRVQLARIYRDQLQDLNSAEDQFNEALNQDERDVEIYDALQSLYMTQERWIDLIQLLQRRFDVFMDDPTSKGYLLQIAQIQDQNISNGSIDAVATYRRVLDEIDPRDELADEEVQRLYRDQENWIDLADYLNAKLPLWSDDFERQINIKRQLANIYQVHLTEPEQALQLHSEVLAASPTDSPTIVALESLFEERVFLREDIAQLLVPLYRENEQWDKLIHVLRTKADVASDPFTKTEILQEIARVCEQQKSPRDYPQALETYGEIFKLTPDNSQARTALYRVAERLRAWSRFVQLYEEAFEESFSIDDQLAARLRLELAHVHEDRLEDLNGARDAYYKVFESESDNKEAVNAIIRLNMRKEDWIDLSDFYDKRSEVEFDMERRAMWLERLAVLYEESLEDLPSAIETYKRTIEILPAKRSLQSALARLLRTTENYTDLAEAYLGFIEQTTDEDDRIHLQFVRAQLLESELDRIDEAIDTYRDILLQRPQHRDTLNELEGLRRDLENRDFDWSTQVTQIVDLLLEHYDSSKDWRRVAELYLHKQMVVDLPDDRRDMLFKAGALYEEHGEDRTDSADAMGIYARAYAMMPEQEEAMKRMERLAQSKESWERVVPILLAEVEEREDPFAQASILTAVARVYRFHIEDAHSALIAYEQALELDSENAIAMDELEKLYQHFSHWDALVALLQKRLEHTYDGEMRVNLLQRIANVHDRVLEKPDDAIDAYEALREQDPSDLTYLDALARLYELRERDHELEEVLSAQANLQDGDRRLGTLKKLAVVQREILGNADGAIETYRNILTVDDEDEQAVEALVTLYGESKQWQELFEMLSVKLDFAASVDSANTIELQIADLLKTHLYQPIDALDRYAKIARRTPDWAPPVEALTQMMNDQDVREESFNVLEEVHNEHQRWDALSDTYQKRLEYLEDPFTTAETYTKLAQVQEFRLSNPTLAFMTYGRAFCILPDQDELRTELERLARTVGTSEELVAVYEDALDRDINDPIVLQNVHTRLGELYYDDMDQSAPAMEHMEKVLSFDDRDPKALNLLDRLYKADERWEDLSDILERKLSVVDETDLAEVRFRLGELRETRFERPFDALDLYREVITAQPAHRGTIEALERMIENHEDLRIDLFDLLESAYTRTDAYAKLSELFKYKLEVVNAPHERAELMRRIADLEITHLDRLQVGFGFLSNALSEDPLEQDIQNRLESLATSHQEDWMWEELVGRYEDIIEAIDDPLRRSELALPAAGWAKDKLGAFERATKLYGIVLDFDPQHEQALLSLESLAREQNQPVALAEVLKRKVDILYDQDARFNAFAELGQVYIQLEKYEESINAFREAWMLDTHNVQVMQALATLYEATERHEDHVEILEHMIREIDDEQQRLDLLVQMGNLCAEKLEQPARAIGALEQAQQIHPEHIPVLRALEGLYDQSEDYNKLGQNLDRQMELASSDDDRVRVLVRRAQIAYKQSNDAELAITLFQQAQQIDPNHALIASSLDELYRQEERWVDVFNLYYNRLQVSTDATERATLAVDMAKLSHQKLGDSNTAIQYVEFALQTDSKNLDALETLEGIYQDAGDLPQVAQVMGMQLDVAQTNEDKVAIYRKRAKLYVDALGNPQGAVDDLVQALNLNPEDGDVFAELKTLLEKYESWEQLYDVLSFRAQLVPEEDRKKIYLEMASVAEKMGDPARRVQALEFIYQTSPDDLEVVQPLLDAYIAGNYFDKAEPMLNQIITTLREQRKMRDVVKFLHLQGKLSEQKGDNSAAMSAYEEAHKIDASYLPNLLSLGRISYHTGDLDRARTLFQTMQLHQMNIKDNTMKVDMFYYLGMVRLGLGETKRAEDMFKRVLRIDANHAPTKQQLDMMG